VDFLGWVHFLHHRQIRTVTKKRIFRQMAGPLRQGSSEASWPKPETINSYRGLLGHGDTYKVRKYLKLTTP
jgi:hypothetical protein